MCGQPVSPYSHCSRGGTAVTVNGSVRRLKGGVWAASISLQSLQSRWHGSYSQWFGEEVEGRCVGSQYLLTVTAVEVARQLQSMVR